MPTPARRRPSARPKWQIGRLLTDHDFQTQATARRMCQATTPQSFIASQSAESSSKRLPLICICESTGSGSMRRFTRQGTICAMGCPYRTIVTTARSLWTKESNPEKFAFASLTFITVGMTHFLSFKRRDYTKSWPTRTRRFGFFVEFYPTRAPATGDSPSRLLLLLYQCTVSKGPFDFLHWEQVEGIFEPQGGDL